MLEERNGRSGLDGGDLLMEEGLASSDVVEMRYVPPSALHHQHEFEEECHDCPSKEKNSHRDASHDEGDEHDGDDDDGRSRSSSESRDRVPMRRCKTCDGEVKVAMTKTSNLIRRRRWSTQM